ncbi:A24 family peptidase [Candidatus Woesearchaeota archaeon]|nr:MAG: A24 family peptidase [Candidatus Woesearchaeota archaeon]
MIQEILHNGNLTLFLLGLGALTIGSASDIKTREVPDWVSYGLIISAAAARTMAAVQYGSWSILTEGLLGFIVFVLIAYLMFYTGQWGGGDAKLLMGLGMVIGLKPEISTALTSDLTGFLVNVLLVGSVYGLLWSIYLALTHWKKFRTEWKANIQRYRKWRAAALAAGIALLAAAAALNDFLMKLFLAMISIFAVSGYYVFIFIKAVEKSCMFKKLSPDKLTEGDWIAEDVVVGKKKITGPDDLGISREQIKELKKLASEGKIDRVLVKEGIPFVPSFLIAYILQFTTGSILNILHAF